MPLQSCQSAACVADGQSRSRGRSKQLSRAQAATVGVENSTPENSQLFPACAGCLLNLYLYFTCIYPLSLARVRGMFVWDSASLPKSIKPFTKSLTTDRRLEVHQVVCGGFVIFGKVADFHKFFCHLCYGRTFYPHRLRNFLLCVASQPHFKNAFISGFFGILCMPFLPCPVRPVSSPGNTKLLPKHIKKMPGKAPGKQGGSSWTKIWYAYTSANRTTGTPSRWPSRIKVGKTARPILLPSISSTTSCRCPSRPCSTRATRMASRMAA